MAPIGRVELQTGRTEEGPVKERLVAEGAQQEVLAIWRQLVAEEILPEEEDDQFLP